MTLAVTDLHRLLELTDQGGDRFLAPGTPNRLRRTFGGQVAAQALAAATRTVPDGLHVHSLHAYFLREADPKSLLELTVERTRDGRSFCTRQVTASQGHGVFVMLASFHGGDPGPEHPEVQALTTLPAGAPEEEAWPGFASSWPDWEVRRVPGGEGPTQQFWIRHRLPLGDDPVLQSLALTYLSDLTLLGVANMNNAHTDVQMASLDHAMWFLHPARVDDWLLYDQRARSTGGGRALTEGRLYNTEGLLVASVVQQGLMRFLK